MGKITFVICQVLWVVFTLSALGHILGSLSDSFQIEWARLIIEVSLAVLFGYLGMKEVRASDE